MIYLCCAKVYLSLVLSDSSWRVSADSGIPEVRMEGGERMNAIIVDIQGKYAAALDENGGFVKIPNVNYTIGQTIELHELQQVRTLSLKKMGSIAAAAALALCIGTGTAYALPYGTVNLEADSAIEYTINRFDRVLKVRALNEEGEAVLSSLDGQKLRYRPVEEAIAVTLEQQRTDEENKLSVQIVAETKSERHTERLQEQLISNIPEGFPVRPDVMPNTFGLGIPENQPDNPGSRPESFQEEAGNRGNTQSGSPNDPAANLTPSPSGLSGSGQEPVRIQEQSGSIDSKAPSAFSPNDVPFDLEDQPDSTATSSSVNQPPADSSTVENALPGSHPEGSVNSAAFVGEPTSRSEMAVPGGMKAPDGAASSGSIPPGMHGTGGPPPR